MASPRQESVNQAAQDTARRTAAAAEEMRRSAEETTRRGSESAAQFGRSALEASERATHTGTDLIQQNADAMRRIWQSSLQMMSQMGGRSTEELARTFGLSGEEVRQAHDQSSRNVDAIVETSAVLTQGVQGIAREYFDFARKRIEHNLTSLNELARIRTPQQLAAFQSGIVRDNLEDILHASRRMAEISARLAEEAMGKMTANIEKAGKRAA
jgi:hypothetical protein